MNKLRTVVLGLGITGFGLIGCSGQDQGDDGPAAMEAVGAEAQALAGEYVWSESSGAITMIPVSQGFCYITRFTGKLRSASDYAYLNTDSSGRWYIGGTSTQGRLGINARCVNWNAFSASGVQAASGTVRFGTIYSTTPPEQTNDLGQGSSFCYLVGIGGDFGHGGGEWSTVEPGGTGWIQRTHWQSGTGLTNRYACVALRDAGNHSLPVIVGPRTSIHQAEETYTSSHYASAVALHPASDGICAISKVGGRFSGGGEHVGVVPLGGDWVVEADSGRGVETQGGDNAIKGDAQCIYFHG